MAEAQQPKIEHDESKVWDLIKDIRICQMVTQDKSGRLFARPMSAMEHDENGVLWFFTAADSPKVEEIQTNPSVLLSYSETKKNNYVSISGQASIVRDRAKIDALWSEFARTWFPEGKDDPNLCLLKVEPETAEYWDSPASAIVIALGYAKARLTGKPERMGENAIVRM